VHKINAKSLVVMRSGFYGVEMIAEIMTICYKTGIDGNLVFDISKVSDCDRAVMLGIAG
jgi:hypothetical protein